MWLLLANRWLHVLDCRFRGLVLLSDSFFRSSSKKYGCECMVQQVLNPLASGATLPASACWTVAPSRKILGGK